MFYLVCKYSFLYCIIRRHTAFTKRLIAHKRRKFSARRAREPSGAQQAEQRGNDRHHFQDTIHAQHDHFSLLQLVRVHVQLLRADVELDTVERVAVRQLLPAGVGGSSRQFRRHPAHEQVGNVV